MSSLRRVRDLVVLGFFACMIVSATPAVVSAADLSFSPETGSFVVGKEFSIKVQVVPGTDSVNASDGTVTFDKDILSVVSVSKEGSVFSLWTADPTFSNTDGTVVYSGGTPSAFSKTGMVVTIKFKAKKVGTAALGISKGSVLAADGKGTDVYKKGGTASLTIIEAEIAPPSEPDPPADDTAADSAFGGEKPALPVVNSSTHPKPDNWFASSTVELSWKVPPDVVSIKTLLSDKDNGTPTAVLKSTLASQTFTNVADGEHYFYIQFKNESGWSDVAKRKILVDTTPPTAFEVQLTDPGDGSLPKLQIQVDDVGSGMEKYEIVIGTSTTAARAQDVVGGLYPVPPQAGGLQLVIVKAYDKAGNVRESQKELNLPSVAKPTAKGAVTEEVVKPSPWTPERILLIIFAFIIGILITIHMQAKKKVDAVRLKLLSEVSEIRDRNDKIFGAMREEFEMMINNFDEKPQLTPAERDLLEQIKEVLEISEELVDTGMDELKKKIRD